MWQVISKCINLPATIRYLFPDFLKIMLRKICFVESFKMVSILFLCFYSWTEDLRQGWKSNLERNGCELSDPRFTTKPFLFSMKIVLCAVVYLWRRSGWFKLFHTLRRYIVPQTISDISCYSPCKNINKLIDRWPPVEIGKLSSLSNPKDILCESLRRLLSFLL